jgi:hypothetical protein
MVVSLYLQLRGYCIPHLDAVSGQVSVILLDDKWRCDKNCRLDHGLVFLRHRRPTGYQC